MYRRIASSPERSSPRGDDSLPVVYVAEDDPDQREVLTSLLVRDGYLVRPVPDGARLFDLLFRDHSPGRRLPDVIITDHRMPGYCSLDILDGLAEVDWTIPVIVVTAYGPEVRSLARSHGATAVFEKPFDPDELRRVTRSYVNWSARRLRGGK